MEAADKKLQEILSEKFKEMELDVDPSVWQGVNASIQSSGATPEGSSGLSASSSSSSLLWIAAATLVVAIGALLYVSIDKDVAAEETAIPQPKAFEEEVEIGLQEENAITDNVDHVTEQVVVKETVKPILVQEETREETPTKQIEKQEIRNLPEPQPAPVANSSNEENTPPPVWIENSTEALGEDPAVTEEIPVQEELYHEDSKKAEREEVFLIERPLPNVFSPNNDGINDVYLPHLHEEAEGIFRVVSMRNGQVVYESDAIRQGWSGVDRNGRPVENGSYLYVVELRSSDGSADEATQLIRVFR